VGCGCGPTRRGSDGDGFRSVAAGDVTTPRARDTLQVEADSMSDDQGNRLDRQTCEAPDCTNPGGAFTSERDGRIYQFCSEGCRARFESAPA
jgi:hypothetical protein